MCLITEQKEPFIAKEDIIVYKEVFKIGKNIYKSIYNPFIWKLNKLYKVKLIKEPKNIHSSFHDDKSRTYYFYVPEHLLISISEGFHSMDKNRAKEAKSFNKKYGYDGVVIECKIPKASLYYKDETGLYVSNQLIMLKEVKLKDLT